MQGDEAQHVYTGSYEFLSLRSEEVQTFHYVAFLTQYENALLAPWLVNGPMGSMIKPSFLEGRDGLSIDSLTSLSFMAR